MVKPLNDAFGWSRGEITGCLVFLSVFGVFLFPLIGRVVDRIGARKVAVTGLCIFVVTLSAIGLSGPSLWSWYLAWAVLALFFCPISTNVWATPVVGRFRRNRGLALGLMLTGSGLANTFIPPLVVALTDNLGWRAAYFSLGGLALVFTLPLTLLFFKDAPNVAIRASVPDAPPAPSGMNAREVLATLQFWKLFGVICVTGGICTALQVHLQPIFIDGGLTAGQAAAMISIFGPALILGRLGVGFTLDRAPGPVVAAITTALPALTMLLVLNYDGEVWKGVLAAGLLGLAYGAEVDLIAYLSSRYFGLKNYSTVYGLLLAALVVGLGSTPGIVGYAFDSLGSYNILLKIMIALSLLVSLMAATLGRYPQWDSDTLRH